LKTPTAYVKHIVGIIDSCILTEPVD